MYIYTLQVFTLKGTRNEINRNDCTFYKIYLFISKISKECIDSCKCVNKLILSYSAHQEPLLKAPRANTLPVL